MKPETDEEEQKPAATLRLAILGLMAALTAVFTLIIRIPMAPTRGYLNLGDGVVYFTALTFGPWTALISGGLGTALADIIGGYAQWAPVSFLAHGLQGLLGGLCFSLAKAGSSQAGPGSRRAGKVRWAVLIPGFLAGTAAMAGLYFLFAFITIGPGGALAELPGNLIQNAAGIFLGTVLWIGVRRAYPPITRYRW